jgi:RNA polymerase sigma factor (sigma-70 family)
VRDDPVVIDLVTRARDGDKSAWDQIVARYAPLVWSICRHHELARPDIDDVGQGVWLRLVEHLPELRDPAALPGWITTITRRECIRVIRASWRAERHEGPLPDALAEREQRRGGPPAAGSPEAELLKIEMQAALRDALASLPDRCQQLLALLIKEPPLTYAEIGSRLGLPVGSIGPNRSRCLAALRRSPALAALISGEPRGEEAEHAAR